MKKFILVCALVCSNFSLANPILTPSFNAEHNEEQNEEDNATNAKLILTLSISNHSTRNFQDTLRMLEKMKPELKQLGSYSLKMSASETTTTSETDPQETIKKSTHTVTILFDKLNPVKNKEVFLNRLRTIRSKITDDYDVQSTIKDLSEAIPDKLTH
jgi:ribonucleotide reductase alpha subunit